MAVVLAHVFDGVLEVVAHSEWVLAGRIQLTVLQVCRDQAVQKGVYQLLGAFDPRRQISRVQIGRAKLLIPLVPVNIP